MPFADVSCSIAFIPERVDNSGLIVEEAVFIADDAVDVRISAGEYLAAIRRTDGTAGEGMIENDTFLSQAVKVWRLNDPIAVAAQRAVAQLIGKNEEDIWLCHKQFSIGMSKSSLTSP